jgi:hypothetical protein
VLHVVARAEVELRWEELLERFRRHLPHETFLLPRQPELQPRAWIEVGAADPVELSLRGGLFLAQARTGAWGPGYHQQVVALVEVLGQALPQGWDAVEDNTGHYRERDRSRLERAFLRYAHALWDPDMALTGLGVGLALGEGPLRVPAGQVATSTGFKSAAWIRGTREALRRALRQPERPLSPRVRDAFLWWRAEPDAHDWTQLGRVLCTCDVIWRPLRGEDTPEQLEVRERAFECFSAALELDPRAPVPRPELERLAELLGRPLPGPVQTDKAEDTFAGGYREDWIRRSVGEGWNLALPGWLRASCDETDGHEVFWDEGLTLHLSEVRHTPQPFVPEEEVARHLAALPPKLAGRARVELSRHGSVHGYTLIVEGALVQGQLAWGEQRLSYTIVIRDPAAGALALQLGRGLAPLRRASDRLPQA